MVNENFDPRADILERKRALERRITDVLGRRAVSIDVAARGNALPAPARADLTWMADLVCAIEHGRAPDVREAQAFAAAAHRVAAAVNEIEAQKWGVRLVHALARAATAAMIAAGVSAGMFVMLFIAQFWFGRPLPGGYEPVMFGTMKLAAGSFIAAAAAAAAMVMIVVPRVRAGLLWMKVHPFRASVWGLGLPIVCLFTYMLVGMTTFLYLVGGGLVLAALRNGSKSGNQRHIPPDFDPNVPATSALVSGPGAVYKGDLVAAETKGYPTEPEHL